MVECDISTGTAPFPKRFVDNGGRLHSVELQTKACELPRGERAWGRESNHCALGFSSGVFLFISSDIMPVFD